MESFSAYTDAQSIPTLMTEGRPRGEGSPKTFWVGPGTLRRGAALCQVLSHHRSDLH